MNRIFSALLAVLFLFSASFAIAEDEIEGYGALGESYEMGKASVKLVAYYVDHVKDSSGDAIFLVFEFTNNGTEPMWFGDEACYYIKQDGEEIYMVLAEDPRLDHTVQYCDPGATLRFTDAYYLYDDLKKEVEIELFETAQLFAEHFGEVYYFLDLANEPKAIAEEIEWDDL